MKSLGLPVSFYESRPAVKVLGTCGSFLKIIVSERDLLFPFSFLVQENRQDLTRILGRMVATDTRI